MKHLCVIGDPIEHSLSPAMHNAALAHLDLDKEYVFEKAKVPSAELAGFINRTRKGEFTGLSVTMPHKVAVIPFLDELSQEAKIIGAVNTVTLSGNKLVGHNTDGAGCVMALKSAGVPIKGRNAVVLGAGGAAKAIAVALALEHAGKIFILNRTPSAADKIAATVSKVSGSRIETSGLERMEEALAEADILINATPIGMSGISPRTAVPKDLFRRNMNVFDIVYEPMETQHLRDARMAGARTIPGVEMLLHQGAVQFKLFTGRDAPLEVMRAALLEGKQ
ncbi:MAG: shikimate dehydrogenase [Thermoplasmata archaeon]|nr:shikimate dehydrogenase [Thermoplasmata archaeon]